jgi:hypothetical protein
VPEGGVAEGVAGEEFMGEREAFGGDDEREHELFAVAPGDRGCGRGGRRALRARRLRA